MLCWDYVWPITTLNCLYASTISTLGEPSCNSCDSYSYSTVYYHISYIIPLRLHLSPI